MCEGEIKLPIIAQCKHNYHTRELDGGCKLPLPTSTVHKPAAAAGGNICQSINFTLGRSFFIIHFIMYYVGILADGNVWMRQINWEWCSKSFFSSLLLWKKTHCPNDWDWIMVDYLRTLKFDRLREKSMTDSFLNILCDWTEKKLN